MKRTFKLLVALMLTFCLLITTAMAEEGKVDMAGMKVGVSWYAYSSTSAIRNLDYMVYRLRERGAEVYYASADSSVEKQIADLESFIEQDVDLVIMNPCQADGFQDICTKLKEADIPLFLVGNELNPEIYSAGDQYVTFMRNQHYAQGAVAADLAHTCAQEELEGNAYVLVLFGTPGQSSSTLRTNGFSNQAAEYDDVVVLSIQTARNKSAEAQSIVENYLMSSGGPDEEGGMNVIVCLTHNCAIGAMAGVENMGYELNKDVYVIETDGVKESLQSIMDGDMYAAVESPAFYADDAMDLIEAYLNGEELDAESILPFKIFTPENAEEWRDNFALYDSLIGLEVD